MATAVEKQAGELAEKRNRLAGYYKKKDADGRLAVSDAERGEMKALIDDINDLEPKYQKARADEAAEQANDAALKSLRDPRLPEGFHGTGGQGGNPYQGSLYGGAKGHDGFALGRDGQPLGLGDLFIGSKAYKGFADERAKGGEPSTRIEANGVEASLKTLFSRTAGYDPFVQRNPGIVLSAQQMPKVIDLIPQAETLQAAIRWMLETTYTNNAAETAEAAQYPESAFAYTEQTSPVQKIAHFLPVTDEALADTPGLRDTLNGRLELGLKQRLDKQLLVGNGTSPNLRGLLNTVGMGSQAYAAGDSIADAMYKALVGVQTTAFTDPSGIVMNPLDWQTVRLSKNSQGTYLFGTPDSSVAQRLWGLPVVTTTYIPQGTALIGDFAMFCQLYYRAGIDFLVSNSHADYFIKGIQAIRAQMRAAFVVSRPTAFTKVALSA